MVAKFKGDITFFFKYSIAFQYNFHNERKAIAEYEKERAARSARANEEPVCSKATPASITPDTALRKVRSEGILEPSPAPINNNPLRKAKTMKPCAVNSFEEFEAKPSLFDLLEMNTIDDKAALEEVLLASTRCGKHTCTSLASLSLLPCPCPDLLLPLTPSPLSRSRNGVSNSTV
ncbi:unnamed protein product [Toxocara canis]|uniref:Uncharacterized protein n=1 Tax=Toxocara canis TaxID=6265 RepID=A0A183UCU0_TOXCA|nr:unnamed protein product [Toxocara canis]